MFPSARDLPNLGIKPRSTHIAGSFFPAGPPGKPKNNGVGSLSLRQGNLPDPGIELSSPALWADSLPAELQGKPFGGRETKNLELKCPVYIVVLRIIQTG